MSARRLSVPIMMVLLAGALGLIALLHRHALVHWIAGAGWAGMLAFACAYVLATLLLVPPGILNALSGALFGLSLGMAVVLPANIAAALIAFLISRATGSAWAQAECERRRSWAAVNRAVGKAGFKFVFLLRCSPISPFSLLNYALGLTCVRFRHYALASIVGSVPGTLLYVCAGSAAASAADLLRHGARPAAMAGQIFLWAGLVATATAVAIITRYARTELRQATREQ